jgi:hypothetical protein
MRSLHEVNTMKATSHFCPRLAFPKRVIKSTQLNPAALQHKMCGQFNWLRFVWEEYNTYCKRIPNPTLLVSPKWLILTKLGAVYIPNLIALKHNTGISKCSLSCPFFLDLRLHRMWEEGELSVFRYAVVLNFTKWKNNNFRLCSWIRFAALGFVYAAELCLQSASIFIRWGFPFCCQCTAIASNGKF